MKTCTKCGAAKALNEFHKDGDRLRSWCRPCYNSINNGSKNARSNAISRLTYKLAGGQSRYYAMAAEERKSLRAVARGLYEAGHDYTAAVEARKTRKDGFVYAIVHPRLDGVKIGRAFDPVSRLANYQTGCPQRAYELHYVSAYVSDCMTLEGLIHDRLTDARLEGEWFSVSPTQAQEAIDQLTEEVS